MILTNYISEIIQIAWQVIQRIELGGLLENFVGGLAVVLVLFLCKEFHPKKNLSGEWEVTNTVEDSDYNPYNNLKVTWKMHLLQNGDTIFGSGEKFKDVSSDGTEHEYAPQQRDSVELNGYIERNYLRKSRIFINVIQVGRLRRSRATYILKHRGGSELAGRFLTTAGNSRGISVFKKNA